MGVRNEVVQSVGKGQVHADSLSLALSPFFFPPVPLYAPTSRVLRQSGKRLLFLLLLVTTFKYSTENAPPVFFFVFLFFLPPHNSRWRNVLQFDMAS